MTDAHTRADLALRLAGYACEGEPASPDLEVSSPQPTVSMRIRGGMASCLVVHFCVQASPRPVLHLIFHLYLCTVPIAL